MDNTLFPILAVAALLLGIVAILIVVFSGSRKAANICMGVAWVCIATAFAISI